MTHAPELQPTALSEMDTTREGAFRIQQRIQQQVDEFGIAMSDLHNKSKTVHAAAKQFNAQVAEQLAEQVTNEMHQAVTKLRQRINLNFRGWRDDSSTQQLNDSKE